ncbi:hypothetical protein [Paenibacillus sp. GCM10012303]|uniref:hypothetical protein n=1 Tax=Paenibacillus sp. GCM10012303 TaxID=3317340 RepID=UPI003608A3DF
MSNKSLQIKLNSQTSNVNRGGEKKVMKKSLSVLVATAMVSSMFASVAFAAELTTQEKLDALIAAGIFDKDGTGQGSELEAKMSREQLAKIVALLKKLEVQSGTSYTDVAADRWSAGFIQAVSKVKPMIMDGVADGVFDPSGDVTLEQLATVAVRALGLTVKTDAEVKGDVSDWAKGYVATAVANGLLPDAANTDFTKPAIRAQLVEATYAAKEVLAEMEKPAKVSVKEVKATGVTTVQVTFDRDVADTAKAEFTLKKGTQNVTIDTAATKWSEDKKTATLKLKDMKISAGEYTLTFGGIGSDNIGTATGSFTAEDEKVVKLDFVNPSEKVAKSSSVIIKLKAENQYGELATINGGSYTAYVAGNTANITRNQDTGYLELKLNTKIKTFGSPNVEYQSEVDVIPVTVFLASSSSNVQVQRTFKVGVEPYVTKIGLGTIKYPNAKDSLNTKDEVAEIPIERFDQYGDIISYSESYDANFKERLKADAIITPYSFDSLELVDKGAAITSDNYDKVKIQLKKNIEKSGDYIVTVFVGAASQTATLKVNSTKIATKVEFGSFSGSLANGDVDKYIPIVAYDAEGKQLSAQEIADNAAAERFNISISGADYNSGKNGNAAVVQTGEHRGKIKLDKVTASAKGIVHINLGIYSANIQDGKTVSIPVQEARKPEVLAVDGSKPAQKAVEGGSTTFKIFVKDSNGEKLPKTIAAYENDYKVRVTVTGGTYAAFTGLDAAYEVQPGVYEFKATEFEKMNSKELKLVAGSATGTAKIKAELIDTRVAGNPVVLSTVESSQQVLPINTELTYSVAAIKDLYAARDSALTPAGDKKLDYAADGWAFDSNMARKLSVTAKDKSGDTVAIPAGRIASATSSENTVANAVYSASEVKVIGNKSGTATITAVVKKLDGNSQDFYLTVNVKNDAVVASTITAGNTAAQTLTAANLDYTATNTNKKYAYNLFDLKVTDNYGIEYKTTNIYKYRNFIGVQYLASDVKGGGSVSISQEGEITVSGTVTGFTLKAITSNGKSVSIDVVGPNS